MSKKILLVTGDGGESYEAMFAIHRFREAGWEPVVAAPARRRLHMVIHDTEPGWDTYVERPGYVLEADVAITAVSAKEFAGLLLLGGRAPEYLRNDASLVSLVLEFDSQAKWIFAIGHGIQVLVAADLVRGRRIALCEPVEIEVEHGGGIPVERPVVRDGKVVTASTWRSHPEFYREIFAALGEVARTVTL